MVYILPEKLCKKNLKNPLQYAKIIIQSKDIPLSFNRFSLGFQPDTAAIFATFSAIYAIYAIYSIIWFNIMRYGIE